MSLSFLIGLCVLFVAATLAALVHLSRRILRFSADEAAAVASGRTSRAEWRRDTVLYLTCGVMVLLALLDLSVSYVRIIHARIEHGENTSPRSERAASAPTAPRASDRAGTSSGPD